MSEMQRYRVNYRLLISLVVGLLVVVGGSYFLWGYQVDRNATRLLAKADYAEKQGEVQEAYESLEQYVLLRSQENDARLRLGQVAIKLANQEVLDFRTRREAYYDAVNSVLVTKDPKLRRELVDLQMKFRAFDLALQNINELLNHGKGDAELKAFKARALFETQKSAEGAQWCYRLIGYDQKTGEFDAAKAEAPDQPIVYALLAQHLRNSRDEELGKRVVDQMAVANPESREAYIFQYQLFKATGDNDKARAALDKAFALDPVDASVLSSKGIEAIADYQLAAAEAETENSDEKREAAKVHLETAAKFFADAIEKYPDRIGFYETAARIELMREKPDAAQAIADSGLKKFPLKGGAGQGDVPQAISLVNLKIDILIGQKDFDGAKRQLQVLRDLDNARIDPVADFHEARLLAVNEQWAEAARRLHEIKPRLLGFTDLQGLAGAVQGFCHVQLGQFDLALDAVNWALGKSPNQPQALALRDDLQRMRGDNGTSGTLNLDRLIQDMLAKPKAEQDWKSVTEKIDAYIEDQAKTKPFTNKWIASRKHLLHGQTFGMRASAAVDEAEKKELFLKARAEITEAAKIDPDDPTVTIAVCKLLAQEPQNGPGRALQLLDKKLETMKDSAALRVLRVELLFAVRDEQLPTQLEAATQGMDEWPANQQALVWSAVGERFGQLGKFADATRCLTRAADLAPNSLPFRLALFDMALKQGDDPAMLAAQDKVLEIVKSKTSPEYVLTEVKRRMIGFGAERVSREELQEARTMLTQAIKRRPAMADLYVASGQLYLVLEKDAPRALQSLDEALEYGPANFNAVSLQVTLLAESGRFQEARQRMDRLPLPVWSAVLGRTAADVLRQVGELPTAFAEAQKVAEANPQDASIHMWLGEIAFQAKENAVAETAMKKALELNPSDPDMWMKLVGLYLQLKRPNDVEHTLREAQIALDEEFLPLLTGKYYELQSRWQEAEDIYLTAYADRLDQLPIARRLAEFYLTWTAQNDANRGKAAVHINRILRAASEGEVPKDDANVVWARQRAARLLSLNNDYQDSLKAEQLLTTAMEGATPSIEDQEFLIDVLSLRGDPGSRERVVAMLRKIKAERGLTPERDLHLGHALFDLGRWEECRDQMEDAIGRNPNHIGLQTAYASMLIQRNDFRLADSRILRLSNEPEAVRAVAELRLRLANAEGKKDELRSMLTSMTPNLTVLNEEQLKIVHAVAQLAESVGDREYALAMMREFARRAPGNELELARFTALYGTVEEGVAALNQQFDGNMDQVLTYAVEMLRARRGEAPQLDAEVDRLIQAALRDDPESARRLILQAEVLEVQGRFEDSINAYEKLLARDDVPKLVRATALNNIAFLLALESKQPEYLDTALQSVNEAMEIVGPISDILDTRALVYLARSEFDKAVADMKMSVKIGATPSKYFHLAAAQLGAGDQQAALDAWAVAESKGIGPEKVSKLEQEELEEFVKKIEALRSSTPQL